MDRLNGSGSDSPERQEKKNKVGVDPSLLLPESTMTSPLTENASGSLLYLKRLEEKKNMRKRANWIPWVCVHLESPDLSPKDMGLTSDGTKTQGKSSLPTGTNDHIKAMRFYKHTAIKIPEKRIQGRKA